MPVTLQMLVGVVLVCLGVLLGSTWTALAFQSKHRRQIEERRQLNEERRRLDEKWAEVRRVRWWRGLCPRCRAVRSDRSWYFAQAPVQDPPEDD
jgi:hypothetical protein